MFFIKKNGEFTFCPLKIPVLLALSAPSQVSSKLAWEMSTCFLLVSSATVSHALLGLFCCNAEGCTAQGSGEVGSWILLFHMKGGRGGLCCWDFSIVQWVCLEEGGYTCSELTDSGLNHPELTDFFFFLLVTRFSWWLYGVHEKVASMCLARLSWDALLV